MRWSMVDVSFQGIGSSSSAHTLSTCKPCSRFIMYKDEPFAKFASRWDLLPGRVVIPGSAGVPPAQDLAGSWRLASQGWSVHLPTGAGAAPLQECGRDARAPRGKPMAGQVQIRILQKARMLPVCTRSPLSLEGESTRAKPAVEPVAGKRGAPWVTISGTGSAALAPPT